METGTWKVKTGLAQMLKGGVIMDVVSPEHAKIAEEAGACAVMALERVPADIRAAGGVARMADPTVIEAIMKAVSIPVMAKCRIGHFVEAQALEALAMRVVLIRAEMVATTMLVAAAELVNSVAAAAAETMMVVLVVEVVQV